MGCLLRILIVEPRRRDAEALVTELKGGEIAFEWQRVDSFAGFKQAIDPPPDLIISDYRLSDYSAREALELLRRRNIEIPFILLSADIDEKTALKTVDLGATDYLFKDHLPRIRFVVERALAEKQCRDRHRTLQRSFREECRKYREFVEGTRDLVVQTDTEGRYTFANPMVETYLGLPPERCLGLSAFEFVHPEDRETTLAAFDGWVRSGEQHVTFQNRLLSSRGDTFHMSWNIRLYYDSKGRLLHFNGIARDITETIELQGRLREALRTYESIIEASPAAIFAVAPDGTILAWNRSAERVFGWSTEDVLGKPNPSVSPEKQGEFWDTMNKTLLGGSVFQKEVVRRTRDGRDIDISLSTAPLRDEEGRVCGVMAVIFDIGDRKAIEADRQRTTYELGERLKEMNCLFSLADLISLPDLPTEEVLQRSVELLPPAFQYPEIACARIRMPESEYLSSNFAEAPWRLSSTAASDDSDSVEVDVFYREEKPAADEGPFLSEERRMLDAFAERIASFLHQQETRQVLRSLRLRQQHLLETSPAMVFSASPFPPYQATFISGNLKSVLGYEPEDFLGSPGFWLEKIHPGDVQPVLEAIERLGPGERSSIEYRFRHADGSWRWMLETTRLIADEQGRPVEYVGSMSEITERKRAESELLRLNRTLRTVSRCNEALVRARTEEELVERILEILVEAGYPMALVWTEGVESGPFRPVIKPERGKAYIDTMIAQDCHLPTQIAGICRERESREIYLDEELLTCGQCPRCRELSETLRLRSAFALCLGSRDVHLGCLVIFSAEERFIDEEIELFKELADDLAYGIGSLRTEAAHREAREFLRLRNRAIEASINGIMISEARLPEAPIIYVNPAFERITGYSAA